MKRVSRGGAVVLLTSTWIMVFAVATFSGASVALPRGSGDAGDSSGSVSTVSQDVCDECAEIEKAWDRLRNRVPIYPPSTGPYFDPRANGGKGAWVPSPVFQGPVAPAVGSKDFAEVKSSLATEINKAKIELSEAAAAVGRIPFVLGSKTEVERIRSSLFEKVSRHSAAIDTIMKTVVPAQATQITSLSFFTSLPLVVISMERSFTGDVTEPVFTAHLKDVQGKLNGAVKEAADALRAIGGSAFSQQCSEKGGLCVPESLVISYPDIVGGAYLGKLFCPAVDTTRPRLDCPEKSVCCNFEKGKPTKPSFQRVSHEDPPDNEKKKDDPSAQAAPVAGSRAEPLPELKPTVAPTPAATSNSKKGFAGLNIDTQITVPHATDYRIPSTGYVLRTKQLVGTNPQCTNGNSEVGLTVKFNKIECATMGIGSKQNFMISGDDCLGNPSPGRIQLISCESDDKKRIVSWKFTVVDFAEDAAISGFIEYEEDDDDDKLGFGTDKPNIQYTYFGNRKWSFKVPDLFYNTDARNDFLPVGTNIDSIAGKEFFADYRGLIMSLQNENLSSGVRKIIGELKKEKNEDDYLKLHNGNEVHTTNDEGHVTTGEVMRFFTK